MSFLTRQPLLCCSASEFVSEIGVFFTPSLSAWKDLGERSDGREETHVRSTGCQPQWAAQAVVERAGEVADLAAVADRRVDAAPGGRAEECGPDDDHADPAGRAREGALSALAQSRPGVRAGAGGVQDAERAAARAEIARLEETVKEQAIELVALRGKTRSGW